MVVYTADRQWLLLKRADHPAFWQSVTGALRGDEAPGHAARRELFEETGLDAVGSLHDHRMQVAFEILPEWRARYAPGVTHNVEHWFSLCLPAARGIVLNPAEHLAYIWVDTGTALERVTSWSNQRAIQVILEKERNISRI